MTAQTKARYAALSGLSVPVVVVANGRDKYGPVTVLRVTSTPKGQRAYRQGMTLVVDASTTALTAR